MRKQHGLTLIELLITLTVATILLTVAVPAMQSLASRLRTDNAVDQLYQSISYARQLAVAYQSPVTLCPLNNDNQCVNDWSLGYTVFMDSGVEGVWESDADKDGDPLKIEPAIDTSDHLVFNHNRIHFSSDGITSNDGTFTYCPNKTDSSDAKSLQLGASGLVSYLTTLNDCN